MSKSFLGVSLATMMATMAGLAGCAKPDCDKSVAHAYKLLEGDAAKLPDAEKKVVLDALPAQKTEALKECKEGKPRPLTMERQKCILAAKAKADLEKCAN